jgi:hypothetical protein
MTARSRLTVQALLAALLFTAGNAAPGAITAGAAPGVDAWDPHRIVLRATTFDTRTGPDRTAATLTAPPDQSASADYFIVQFTGPIDRAARAAVAAGGGTIFDYIPHHALLVRLAPAAATALRADPRVQWIGLYEPAYRLDPAIGTRSFADPVRRADPLLWVTADFFAGEDPLAIAAAVRAAGGTVEAVFDDQATHRLRVRIAREHLGALARIRGIRWIEEHGEFALRNNTTRWVIQSNVSAVTPIWTRGIHGEGQIIGHIDGRLNRNGCYFIDPLNGNAPGPDHRKLVAYRSSSGFGTDLHGTHTACTAAGDQEPVNGTIANNGIAYRARISHANQSDVTGWGGGPSNFIQYLTWAAEDGARVHTNSWGDDGTTAYTAWCRDIDLFSRTFEDNLVAFAVTNLSTLKTPENAKNCLAVGATQQAPNQANHGSGGSGPTSDGRRKPEVYAPGVGIVSSSTGTCATTSLTGTSMACPAATGLGALVRQYFADGFYPTGLPVPADAVVATGALVKAVLINATVDMTGVAGYPSNREGWGRLLLDNTLYFDGDSRGLAVFDVRHAAGMATGEMRSHTIEVIGSDPLKITLVFTDEPAALGAAFAQVNDLDLEVVAGVGPEAPVYKGNVFSGGQSATGGAFDPLNNAEMVLLAAPVPGTYTLNIYARQVVDATQGYAIVVSGNLPAATAGLAGAAPVAPARLALLPIRPNPFGPSARLDFELPARGTTTLAIYDVNGRLVREMFTGVLAAGAHAVTWDGLEANGTPAPAGVYFVRLAQPGQAPAVEKAVLLR